jgi:membrane-bound lytic murein transglycosylase D
MTLFGRSVRFLMVMFFAILLSSSLAWAGDKTVKPMPKPNPNPAPHYLPSIPKQMDLAGEKVPLDQPFVAEQLDREFIISVHDKAQVVMWMKRARRYFPYIAEELKKAGLPDDLKYLAVAESALLHRISSPAGAVGLWQFIPATGKRYGLKVNRWFDDRRNPEKATAAALSYLKDLNDEFGSWALAMAAYNCGERRVRREIAEQGIKDYYHLYLPRETMRYIYRIMAVKIILSDPAKYGYVMPEEQLYAPLEADSVTLKLGRSMHLRTLAQASNSTVRRLREINPELRSYWLPRGRVTIKVPKGQGAEVKGRLAQAGKGKPQGVYTRPPHAKRVVVVREGDTLSAIAKRNKVKIKDLRSANRIKGSMIKPGQKLVIP